jgi:hypothetical protein
MERNPKSKQPPLSKRARKRKRQRENKRQRELEQEIENKRQRKQLSVHDSIKENDLLRSFQLLSMNPEYWLSRDSSQLAGSFLDVCIGKTDWAHCKLLMLAGFKHTIGFYTPSLPEGKWRQACYLLVRSAMHDRYQNLHYRRDWWKSEAGAHTRWLTRGGGFICLFKSLQQSSQSKPVVIHSTPSTLGLTLDFLQNVSTLPPATVNMIVAYSRQSLQESIDEWFSAHTCKGAWNEAAFEDCASSMSTLLGW